MFGLIKQSSKTLRQFQRPINRFCGSATSRLMLWARLSLVAPRLPLFSLIKIWLASGELSQCETDTFEVSKFKERKTGSSHIANFDYRIESLELEERVEKTLAALKRSQEGEYRIAEHVLVAQKNHLLPQIYVLLKFPACYLR